MMGSSSSRRLDGTTTCSPHDGREEVDVPRVDSEEEVGIPREYAESWLDITMLGLAGDVVGDICNVAPHVSGRQLVKFVAVSAGFPSWEVVLIFSERQLDPSQSLQERLAVEGVTLGQGGTGLELQIVRRTFDWDENVDEWQPSVFATFWWWYVVPVWPLLCVAAGQRPRPV
eukprot:TRINITY_DN10883_c0_g1_i1.p1 TRINITY_DN10883_c0_g1~~TRINITY_DN10883_c0_g1_i1.p1  ORF type:complete len:172 (+),score=26.29 TRINITY_DN10883_c0_g1_i1:99-614(+)